MGFKYDSLEDYLFDLSLDDRTDDEEKPIVNRPDDDPDDWEWTCMRSEKAHRAMLERVAKEYRETQKRIRERYGEQSLKERYGK